jgi:spermidine synthase
MQNLNDDSRMVRDRFAEALARSRGKPFAFDHGGLRSLHFDGQYVQSVMRIAAPEELLLSYTKAMMAFLLARQAPRHILMIGLGGGSLAKYCYRHLPAARITVLELDRDVIALRDAFALPQDDARFEIIHTDACDFVHGMRNTVDVILHDGFVADGLAPSLSTEAFYRRCHGVLDADGVLVSNVFGAAADLLPVMQRLRSVFGTGLWWGDLSGCINRIILSSKDADALPDRSALAARARQLDGRYGLALGDFVARLHSAPGSSRMAFEAIASYGASAVFMPS